MKILLFLFATLFALSHKDLVSTKDLLSSKNRKCKIKCSGETDQFTQYDRNILSLEGWFGESSRIKTFSFFIIYSVNLEHCRLRTVENISTWLSCHTQCHNIFGIQNIYNHGPKGFTVYPTRETMAMTVAYAKEIGLKIHYQVTGECWTPLLATTTTSNGYTCCYWGRWR